MWCCPEDGKELASWYEFEASGLEVGVSFMDRTEPSEVGVFKKLDANIRQTVNFGSGMNPSMPAILTATFLKANNDYHWSGQ